jgi:hypothetical protein
MVDAEIALAQCIFAVGMTESHPHLIEMTLEDTEIRTHQTATVLQPNFYTAVNFTFRSKKNIFKIFY